MIYTVTFNPSLDYVVAVDGFQLGKTNRTVEEQMLPGGKGINVSTVLGNLRIENVALGFTAGFVGQEIERMLQAQGLGCDFIHLTEGCSRINIKLKDFDGTEINAMGPDIGKEALEAMKEKLSGLGKDDMLVLAGSIPATMPDSVYHDIMALLSPKGVDFVVDATKELLLNVLEYRPFLIKPNHHELGEIFKTEIRTREEVMPYAAKLQEKGARNVLVSMGGEGAVLLDEEGGCHMLPAPEGKLINAVGAGDSMVAGFIAGWKEERDYEHAFRMGVAAGSASAFSRLLATETEIRELYNRLG